MEQGTRIQLHQSQLKISLNKGEEVEAGQEGYEHPPAGELVSRPGTRGFKLLSLGPPGMMKITQGWRLGTVFLAAAGVGCSRTAGAVGTR